MVTDNPRHFSMLRRHAIRVLTSPELVEEARLAR
jgi:hypothetical protein